MMILQRVEQVEDGVTKVYFVHPTNFALRLNNLHAESVDCFQHGCTVHFPTATDVANMEGWPYNWRDDRHIMERICPHGIGHPDYDSAAFQRRIGRAYEAIHACDGCCS